MDATIGGFYTLPQAPVGSLAIPRLSCSLFGILQQTQSWRYNKQRVHCEKGGRLRGEGKSFHFFFVSLLNARAFANTRVYGESLFFNGDSRYLRIWSITGNSDWRALWSSMRAILSRFTASMGSMRRDLVRRVEPTHRLSWKNIKILERLLYHASMFYPLPNNFREDVFEPRWIVTFLHSGFEIYTRR